MDAIYRVDGHRVVTSPNAAGPWDISMQHGSAPAALVVWAAEAIATPQPMQIAPLDVHLNSCDFMVAKAPDGSAAMRQAREAQAGAKRPGSSSADKAAIHFSAGASAESASPPPSLTAFAALSKWSWLNGVKSCGVPVAKA